MRSTSMIDEGVIPYSADWLAGKPIIKQQMGNMIPDEQEMVTLQELPLQGFVEELDMLYNDAKALNAIEAEQIAYVHNKVLLYKNKYDKWLKGLHNSVLQYCQTKRDNIAYAIYETLYGNLQINS